MGRRALDNNELFEPGEHLDRQGEGYFSVLAKPSGSTRQDSYQLHLLPTVIKAADCDVDTWITQAMFSQANRRAVNLRSVGLLFADLDTYHNPNLASRAPEEQAQLLAGFCACEELPVPPIVLFSGRGLQAKWLLSEALGPVSLYHWNTAQLALVKLLEPFAADKAARDVSRVLRLDKTINTKSGEYCRVVYTSSGTEKCLAKYDFNELYETLTARAGQEAPKPAKQKSKPSKILPLPADMNLKRLNWFRLHDLRHLWQLRGGVPVGYRELTLFWQLNFLLRAEPGRVEDLWQEAESLAAQIDPRGGWYHKSDLSTLYRKAKEARDGKTTQFAGRTYPPLYTPRNQTIIELFHITSDEEQYLRTIISAAEKYRRKVEKRRAAGVKPRDEYLEASVEAARPWEQEGISRAWWYAKRAKTKEE